jgi:hypothetical protein
MTTPAVPKSTGRHTENPVEEIIDEAEHLFTARPGGMIDSWHKNRARQEAAAREAANSAERIEEHGTYAVKTAAVSPEIFNAITYTIQPNGYAPILPMSMYRTRATALVITTGATAIIARDSGAAISGTGFTLPYGIPLVLTSRAQVYAFNNTASVVQVSVIAESYAPESR